MENDKELRIQSHTIIHTALCHLRDIARQTTVEAAAAFWGDDDWEEIRMLADIACKDSDARREMAYQLGQRIFRLHDVLEQRRRIQEGHGYDALQKGQSKESP